MIVTKKNVKEATKRLEDLKQATLINYLDDINLDDDKSLYDEMMYHFVEGDLDDEFSSSVFVDMEIDDKKELQDLARKYISLCFYDGDVNNWSDSVEVIPKDYELVSLRLFDNYNFLLEIARDGGEKALQELEKFQSCEGYHENAVIDYLRNTFLSDAILRKIILDLSNKDSVYKVFTEEQRASLCRFPEGTLYFFDLDNEVVKFSTPLMLALEINKRITGEEFEAVSDKPDLLFEKLAMSLRKATEFDDVILDMNADYMMRIDKKPKELIDFIKKIDKDLKNDCFVVDDSNLKEFKDTFDVFEMGIRKK